MALMEMQLQQGNAPADYFMLVIAAVLLLPLRTSLLKASVCCFKVCSSTYLQQCTFPSACNPSLICVPRYASQLCTTRDGNLLAVVQTRQ
jgi:hypothetical protein